MFSANTTGASAGETVFLWHADTNVSALGGTYSDSRNLEWVGGSMAGFGDSLRNLPYLNDSGESGYITFLSNFSIAAGQDFGYEAFIYVYGEDATWLNFFYISNNAGGYLGIGNDFGRGPFLFFPGGYLTSGYGVPLPRNTWFHMAFESFGGVNTSYINGIPYQAASWAHSGFPVGSSIGMLNNAETVPIGYPDIQNQFAIDEVRIYRGALRRGQSFTPPTAPY